MTDAVIAAIIGAAAGLAGIYAGYAAGEKQYKLDHDRTITNLIVTLSGRSDNDAKTLVLDFCKARVFDDDTLARLHLIWPHPTAGCPTLNDKK
jgi:hypothetical protein